MKDQHSDLLATDQSGSNPVELSKNPEPSSPLMQLFEDELKEIYWAEKASTKFIPRMTKYATSEELIEALRHHTVETEEHVRRIEQIFQTIGKKAIAKKSEGMEGLIKEARAKMEECEEGSMCDTGIISAGQKFEHYEIASYGTLRQLAETLGLDAAEKLLRTTLSEERATDELLSEIALVTANLQATKEVSLPEHP